MRGPWLLLLLVLLLLRRGVGGERGRIVDVVKGATTIGVDDVVVAVTVAVVVVAQIRAGWLLRRRRTFLGDRHLEGCNVDDSWVFVGQGRGWRGGGGGGGAKGRDGRGRH